MHNLKRLVADLGQKKTGDLIGCSQQMVNHVLKGHKRFSPQRAIQIEARTKGTKFPIKRGELRPDLWAGR